MNTVSTCLTTKGQITVPKKIRDLLNVGTGDELDFLVSPSGEVSVRRSNSNIQLQTISNLLRLLTLETKTITIVGSVATGKSKFGSWLSTKHFHDKSIGIVEPTPETTLSVQMQRTSVKHFMDLDTALETSELPEVLLIEGEVQIQDVEKVRSLQNRGILVILLRQVLSEQDRSKLGNHISILMCREQRSPTIQSIALIQQQSDNFTSIPYTLSAIRV